VAILGVGLLGALTLITIVAAFVFADRLPVLPELLGGTGRARRGRHARLRAACLAAPFSAGWVLL
jgi:hypothetical protein